MCAYLYYVWTPVHVSVYLNEVMFCYLYNAVQIHNGMIQNCTKNGAFQNGTLHNAAIKNNMLQNGNRVHRMVYGSKRYITKWHSFKTVHVTKFRQPNQPMGWYSSVGCD
jgi:hypothetical protein